ncbi:MULTISPECIES: formyltetrahydrofolate deformylase [Sulfurospirillum]|uniref:Formyltetrahydrofolate deformylase n=1 Tax=Sulfurospirillum cavolei TaxID=366522 RepID=A0A2D3W4G9_9BACT|nr:MULTISPECIES: formyltetrahydrofolate deformylase [Sulfurospirillum]KHG34424.1 MAG: formyltetrahydrofolate deformylase [Sulfurospirillum sp. MES]MCP3650847.1 formyltetrahydrofolate deformylase [Sulfurospirillum sp. DNRA8]MCR1809693.1 formyltetrahydrofolate deformylase [Sulfurospirillum sp. DNRA8]DAB36261.1 MAG TPA: formyltetrahydrofolate deformylase [Sulfurospirillum cavolei]
MQENRNYILKIDCTDEKGLIYRISDVVFKYQLNIIKNDEYVDRENGKFFMRAEVSGEVDMNAFKGTLEAMLPSGAEIYVAEARKKDIILMGTKETHCLGDILLKHDSGDLNANILALVSNYDDLRDLSEKFHIPYHCVSHEGLNRAEHEAKVLEVLAGYTIDYIVLAKYMRILSSEFVSHYEERMINIHHSFLPAFIGANPYKQAYERGVKIIGATAHFVNNHLDEGPIIAQDVVRVNHEMSWKDMQRAGRNVEKVVLSNALDLVFEERIFVHDNKTIIF